MKDNLATLVWCLILAVCAFGFYAFLLIGIVAFITVIQNEVKENKRTNRK